MMYAPAGSSGGNPFPLLKGRPVIAIEQAPQGGTPGDIVLADMSQYVLIDAGMQMAISAESHFNTDETIFRFRWKGSGAPAWVSPITPYNGSTTKSPFVILAQR
jgi:HK97 family phage major capsid protein